MCRNIRTLYNFDPPATEEEIYASSLQYVRKVSGFRKPSQINQAVFENAVEQIAKITDQLISSLKTKSPPKNRDNAAPR